MKASDVQLEEEFEVFRKLYEGVKRGHKTEFDNFKKKHKNWRDVVPLLTPAILIYKEWRDNAKCAGMFVPEWAHLQTYINQSRWETEYPAINVRQQQVSEKEFNKRALNDLARSANAILGK